MRVLGLFLATMRVCPALSLSPNRFTNRAPSLHAPSIASSNASAAFSDPGSVSEPESVTEARSFTEHLHESLASMTILLDVEPTRLFDLLHAGAAKGDLSQSKPLLFWLQYVAKLRRKKGRDQLLDAEIYVLLSETYTDLQLAALFQTLRADVETRDLAERMLVHLLSKPLNRDDTKGAWPNPNDPIENVFYELKLQNANLVDNLLFSGWIRYASAVHDIQPRRHANTVINQERFYYEIYTLLRQTKSMEELPNVFDRLPFVPRLEHVMLGLERVAHWEKERTVLLQKTDPVPPLKLRDEKKIAIGMNFDFLQWLRYCAAYETVAKIRHEEYLATLVDELARTKTLKELVVLLQTSRDAPGLQTFAHDLEVASLAKLLTMK